MLGGDCARFGPSAGVPASALERARPDTGSKKAHAPSSKRIRVGLRVAHVVGPAALEHIDRDVAVDPRSVFDKNRRSAAEGQRARLLTLFDDLEAGKAFFDCS